MTFGERSCYFNTKWLEWHDWKMRNWLKERRLELYLTQQEVADMANISRPFYTQIENSSNNKRVSVRTAKRLATVMDFNWTRLFDEEEDKTATREKHGEFFQILGKHTAQAEIEA